VICTVPLRTGSEGEGEANFGVVSTFSPPAEDPFEEEVPPEEPPEEGCEDGDVPVVALEPAPDPLELEPQPAMSDSVEQASAVNSRAAVNGRPLFIG
jgi:hypothetical protein